MHQVALTISFVAAKHVVNMVGGCKMVLRSFLVDVLLTLDTDDEMVRTLAHFEGHVNGVNERVKKTTQ